MMKMRSVFLFLVQGLFLFVLTPVLAEAPRAFLVGSPTLVKTQSAADTDPSYKYSVSVKNPTAVPFIGLRIEVDRSVPSLSISTRIEPQSEMDLVFAIPDALLTASNPVRVINPSLVGVFIDGPFTQTAYTVSLGTVLVSKSDELHITCSVSSDGEWYETDRGGEFAFGGTESEFTKEQPFFCRNTTPYPVFLSVGLGKENEVQAQQFKLVAESESTKEILLRPGETFSFRVQYLAPPKKSGIKNETSMNIQAKPQYLADWPGETIQYTLSGEVVERSASRTEDAKPFGRVAWQTLQFQGAAPCPFQSEEIKSTQKNVQYGTFWSGKPHLTKDCRLEIEVYPPENSMYSFEAKTSVTGDKDFFVIGNIPTSSPSLPKRFVVYLTNAVRFQNHPFPKEGNFTTTLEIQTTSKTSIGGEERRGSFSFPLHISFRKPRENEALALGKIEVAQQFRLPFSAVETNRLLQLAKDQKDFLFAPLSNGFPIEFFPNNRAAVPQNWDGQVWAKIGMGGLQKKFNRGQIKTLPISLTTGKLDQPEAIDIWPMQLQINDVLEQPEAHMGEVTRGGDRALPLLIPESLHVAKIRSVSIEPSNDFARASGVSLSTDDMQDVPMINGRLPPIVVRLKTSAQLNMPGRVLKMQVSAEVDTVENDRWVIRWPVDAKISKKTNWVLDATMVHGGVFESGAVNQYQWLNRFGFLYHIGGDHFTRSGGHQSLPVGVFVEGGLLSTSQTPFFGLGARFGVSLFPGEQRFLQANLMGYVGYRYGRIGRDKLDETSSDPRYVLSSGASFGIEPSVAVYLGNRISGAKGLLLQGGLRIGGLYGAGVAGLAPEFGVLLAACYRFGF